MIENKQCKSVKSVSSVFYWRYETKKEMKSSNCQSEIKNHDIILKNYI